MANGEQLFQSLLRHSDPDKLSLIDRWHRGRLIDDEERAGLLQRVASAPGPSSLGGIGLAAGNISRALGGAGGPPTTVPPDQAARAAGLADVASAGPTKSIEFEPKQPTMPQQKDPFAGMDPTKMITLGSSSSYTAPQLGGAEGRAVIGSLRQASTDVRSAYGGLTKSRAERVGLLRRSLEETLQYQKGAKGKRDEAHRALQDASANYQKIMARLDEAKIDPDRYMREMPAGRAALAYIASALGGFAEGFSQGKVKNRVVGMLNAAVERDVAAQRTNIQKLLQSAQFAGVERNRLQSMLNMYEDRVRGAVKDTLALRLQEIAIASTDMKAKAQLSQIAAGFAMKEAQVHSMMKPRVTSVTKKGPLGALMAKAQGKRKPLSPDFQLKLHGQRALIEQVGRLAHKIKGKNLTPLSELLGIFGTEGGKYMPQVRALARQLGRMRGVDKGNIAISEGKIMVYDYTGKRWNKAEQTARRLWAEFQRERRRYGKLVSGLSEGHDVPGTLLEPIATPGGASPAVKLGAVK